MALFNFKPPKKTKITKKNMNWGQAKTKYPKLSPFGDADKDGVKNWLDCKPFDKKRQDNSDPKDNAVYLEFSKESEREPMSEEEFNSFREYHEKLNADYLKKIKKK